MERTIYNKDGEPIGTETVYEGEPENDGSRIRSMSQEEFDEEYGDHGW